MLLNMSRNLLASFVCCCSVVGHAGPATLPEVFTQFGAVNEVKILATKLDVGGDNGCEHHSYLAEIDRVAWNIENEYDVTVTSLASVSRELYQGFKGHRPKSHYIPRHQPVLSQLTRVIHPATDLFSADCRQMKLHITGQKKVVMPTYVPPGRTLSIAARGGAPAGGWSLPPSGTYPDVLAVRSLSHPWFSQKYLNDRILPKKRLNNYRLDAERASIYIVLESKKGKYLKQKPCGRSIC